MRIEMEVKCLCGCGETIGDRKGKKFFSDKCRTDYHNKHTKTLLGSNLKVNHSNLGQFAKIKVIEDLIKKGYAIFEPVFSTHNFLIAEKDLQCLKISVRTGYHSATDKLRYRDYNKPEVFEKVNIIAIYDPVNEVVIYKSESAKWKPE